MGVRDGGRSAGRFNEGNDESERIHGRTDGRTGGMTNRRRTDVRRTDDERMNGVNLLTGGSVYGRRNELTRERPDEQADEGTGLMDGRIIGQTDGRT